MPEPKTRCGGRPENCLGGVGHDVDRVGHHQQQRVGRQRHERRHQLAAHRDVGGGEVEPRLAGVLLGARGDHHDVGAGTDLEVVAAR